MDQVHRGLRGQAQISPYAQLERGKGGEVGAVGQGGARGGEGREGVRAGRPELPAGQTRDMMNIQSILKKGMA